MVTRQNIQFSTIDQYIAAQPVARRATLERIRHTIKKVAPEAQEVISYQMPAFEFNGILVWFAVFKDHYSLFPFRNTLTVFKDKLGPYELGKGTIQFPISKPIPLRLVAEIVKFRVKENLGKKLLKEARRAKKIKKR